MKHTEGLVDAIVRTQAVVHFSPDGNVTDANDIFLKMMGYSKLVFVFLCCAFDGLFFKKGRGDWKASQSVLSRLACKQSSIRAVLARVARWQRAAGRVQTLEQERT
jgi:hypothetical protein